MWAAATAAALRGLGGSLPSHTRGPPGRLSPSLSLTGAAGGEGLPRTEGLPLNAVYSEISRGTCSRKKENREPARPPCRIRGKVTRSDVGPPPVRVCARVCVHVPACVCMCQHVSACVCMCQHMYVPACACVHVPICVCVLHSVPSYGSLLLTGSVPVMLCPPGHQDWRRLQESRAESPAALSRGRALHPPPPPAPPVPGLACLSEPWMNMHALGTPGARAGPRSPRSSLSHTSHRPPERTRGAPCGARAGEV